MLIADKCGGCKAHMPKRNNKIQRYSCEATWMAWTHTYVCSLKTPALIPPGRCLRNAVPHLHYCRHSRVANSPQLCFKTQSRELLVKSLQSL